MYRTWFHLCNVYSRGQMCRRVWWQSRNWHWHCLSRSRDETAAGRTPSRRQTSHSPRNCSSCLKHTVHYSSGSLIGQTALIWLSFSFCVALRVNCTLRIRINSYGYYSNYSSRCDRNFVHWMSVYWLMFALASLPVNIDCQTGSSAKYNAVSA